MCVSVCKQNVCAIYYIMHSIIGVSTLGQGHVQEQAACCKS